MTIKMILIKAHKIQAKDADSWVVLMTRVFGTSVDTERSLEGHKQWQYFLKSEQKTKN